MSTHPSILVRPVSGRSEVGRRACDWPILGLILTYRVRGAG